MPEDNSCPAPARPRDVATGDPAGKRPAGRRPLAGLAVGIGVLALVATPALWAGYFALASFTGCFLECSQPDPLNGALWAGISVSLLAVPVLAGLLVARVRRPAARVLVVVGGPSVLVVAWYLAATVV